jgi:hypothetical protein
MRHGAKPSTRGDVEYSVMLPLAAYGRFWRYQQRRRVRLAREQLAHCRSRCRDPERLAERSAVAGQIEGADFVSPLLVAQQQAQWSASGGIGEQLGRARCQGAHACWSVQQSWLWRSRNHGGSRPLEACVAGERQELIQRGIVSVSRLQTGAGHVQDGSKPSQSLARSVVGAALSAGTPAAVIALERTDGYLQLQRISVAPQGPVGTCRPLAAGGDQRAPQSIPRFPALRSVQALGEGAERISCLPPHLPGAQAREAQPRRHPYSDHAG